MTILRANLKHLYQRRALWLWYIVILCQTPLMLVLLFRPEVNRYLGCMAVSFLMGLVLASLQKEILAKPFSFCLPGHRQVPRLILFYIGAMINALLALAFLVYSGPAFPRAPFVFTAAAFTGMLFYFWGMYLGFVEKPNPIVGISIPLIVAGAFFRRSDAAVQHIIISWPLLMIAAGAVTCVWVWVRLGCDDLHRRYCGKLIVNDPFGAANRPKAQRFRLARAWTKPGKIRAAISQRVDTSFLAAMASVNLAGRTPHVLAAPYTLAGRFLATYRLTSLLGLSSLIAFFIVYFGYIPAPGISNMLYIFAAFPLIGFKLLVHPTLLLPEGRREKFYRAVAAAVVAALVGAMALIVLAALSVYLQSILPPITFKERTFTYHAMEVRQFYNFLLFAPVALTLTIIIRRNLLWRIVPFVVLMQFWAVLMLPPTMAQVLAVGPIPIVGLVLLIWLLFLLLLHHHCMKKPLVGQTRQY